MRPVPADQVTSLVDTVPAHVIATLACRSFECDATSRHGRPQ